MSISPEHGGIGASWAGYLRVMRTIASACGSTALTLNMHTNIVRMIGAVGDADLQQRVLGDVVANGAALASVTSEPGSSWRREFALKTVAVPVEGGFRVTGLKHFGSLSEGASYFFVWAKLKGTETIDEGLLSLLVAASSEGAEIVHTWNTMSMRATSSNSVKLDDVFVPANMVVGAPGEVIQKRLIDLFMPGYTAVYTGIAEGAYRYTRDYAMKTAFPPSNDPISHDPTVQAHIAEIAVRLEAARHFVADAAIAAETLPPAERGPRLVRAKWFATETARDVVLRCLDVVGGRGISKSQPLERMIRDATAGPVMPPSSDLCREAVARAELNLPTAGLAIRF
jgi:hypothetical protein